MELSEIFKALGDGVRLRILNLLLIEELCVCEIETVLNISQSNTSRHLAKLKSAQIIAFEKRAQWVHYRIDEVFLQTNAKLVEYLRYKMEEIDLCERDRKRLLKYRSSQYSCDQIGDNKETILRFLEGLL